MRAVDLPDVLDLSDAGKAWFLGYLASRLEAKGRLTKADWREAHNAAQAGTARNGVELATAADAEADLS